ncbi:MAG TPA: PadR family transcriptional regulator [Candidatus Bathyarchaeia archaeon]|nr:PadR family transcriptional regulator [Candidatus Bathyarchaeia archaeon]
MLGRAPKNGAEIMQEIEGMTQGWWRPSPGSVYPLLDELVQEGLIRKREDGRYELTEQSREQIQWPFGMGPRHTQSIEDMLNEIGGYVSYLEDLARTDKSKLAQHTDKIKSLSSRLSSIA